MHVHFFCRFTREELRPRKRPSRLEGLYFCVLGSVPRRIKCLDGLSYLQCIAGTAIIGFFRLLSGGIPLKSVRLCGLKTALCGGGIPLKTGSGKCVKLF